MDYFFKNVLVFDKSVKMYIKNYFEKLGSFQSASPPTPPPPPECERGRRTSPHRPIRRCRDNAAPAHARLGQK